MKLFIFNPEHDLALAANLARYTAPHAGRQLRKDLAFIPALWAGEGDLVMVDDIDDAYDKVRHLGSIYDKVEFITPLQLQEVFKNSMLVDSVHPWGWDKAIVGQLRNIGCPEIMLPTDKALDEIRCLSSREWAARHLQQGVDFVQSIDALREAISLKHKAVVKAPWSSSGRGVRYIDLDANSEKNPALVGGTDMEALVKWAANVIRQQGGVTVEPYYNKVKDFGMEFEMKDGRALYRGLSLFDTIKAAYTGNLLATEEEKVEILSAYVSRERLERIKAQVIQKMEPALRDVYQGPFGVDMMVYATEDGALEVNPCVELNLRRTMGHVALDLGLSDKSSRHLMRVEYDGNRYHLRAMPGRPSEDAPMH